MSLLEMSLLERVKMDRISDLPRHILHRILYFLSQEDAVRTSVLSKSWRYIWCTRPNLHLSYDAFNRTRYTDPCFLYYPLNSAALRKQQEFLSVVDENLQRYYDQRMCLEEFHLSIFLDDYLYQGSVSLLEKWIPLLSNMGVKDFRLTVDSEYGPACLSLPSVVFGAESLQNLYVKYFLLDEKSIQRIVLLEHLTSLRLKRVEIKEEIFQKIISSCPLIEIMQVQGCEGFSKIELNGLHNLKDFSFSMHPMISAEELCSIEIHPPSLETIDISDGNLWFHKGAVFSNLNDLSLCGVKSSLDHFSSCKFPSLQYLGFFGCDGLKGIELFIDAPKIVSFQYRGDFVPSISFGTTSNEWDSEINLKCQLSNVTCSWLLKLFKLLNSLSQSEIYLRIYQCPMSDEDDVDIIQESINVVQDNACNKPVVVERLRLVCHGRLFSSLLNGAFCICRPRNIDNNLRWYRWESDMEVIDCVWKTLMQRESGDQDDQFTQLWFRDLEEVSSMEIYERNQDLWHPTTLSELPNYRHWGYDHLVRFSLKWRETL